jgi:hypothetical protein
MEGSVESSEISNIASVGVAATSARIRILFGIEEIVVLSGVVLGSDVGSAVGDVEQTDVIPIANREIVVGSKGFAA